MAPHVSHLKSNLEGGGHKLSSLIEKLKAMGGKESVGGGSLQP